MTECPSCGAPAAASPQGEGMYACTFSGMRADIPADDKERARLRCDRTKKQRKEAEKARGDS